MGIVKFLVSTLGVQKVHWAGVICYKTYTGVVYRKCSLVFFDGLPGLEEAFRAVYPKADVQHCVVHKVRNTLNRVRLKDREAVAEDLKAIYHSFTSYFKNMICQCKMEI